MKIIEVELTDISQDPANVRRHSERNIESIVASLRAFGQQKPIVIDHRNIILAGNGTYEAAKRLGWQKINVYVSNLQGVEATAFAIADNRTAELAEWDSVGLAEQLRSLQSSEFDLQATGFLDIELDQMLAMTANSILQTEADPPSDFNEVDESIEVDKECPKCGYKWSGGDE